MKAASIIAMRVAPWAIPVLIIGIFGIDLLTPLVWADWLLYFIPLVLSWQSHRVYTPYRLAGLVTLLMALGAYFHSDIDPLVAVLNRGFGIVAMWGFTWLMVRQKGVTDQLGKIELARSHAETHRGAALASLELAEASARGAIQRESQTARQLLASSLRLDGIIQSAMDAIMTVDQDQKVVLFNQAAEQMFGCSVAEAIGQPLDRFLPARFRDAHHHHIQAFGQSGVTSRKMGQLGTVMGIRANGEEFPIEAAISHITVEGKKYYTVILRDITDRKGVEEELKRQHDFIDTVLETAGGLVAVLDRHGAIQRFNRACEQTTGYSSEEVTGKAVWDFLLIPEEVESVKRVFSRLAGGESRNEHENDWVTKGGLRRRIAWTDTVITDGQGNVDYVVATGIDVTELKQV
ncbi:MAG: PAS domain S-box protein, partial [Nitrospirae bacterium]|nr:PAS domain S-box protein [Nitrospirota bacterium]